MINIAKTSVSMVLNTAGFVSSTRSAKKSLEGFEKAGSRSMKRLGSNIGTSFASSIAKITILALSIRRVFRTVLSEFQNLDEARKFAQSIGQAGEYATDKLLAFEYAARRVGASSAVVRTGLRTMSKAIGEAQMGFGEGAQALKIMGLDAKKLGTMLPTEQFLEISRAMNKMANSSIKTAAAQKLFGRSGVRMLNLARQNGAEIERLIKRHRKLAGVLTEDEIAAVEAANDAMGDLLTVYKGIQRAFIAGIGPSLFVWLSTAADLIAKVRDKAKELGQAVGRYIIKSLRIAAKMLPGIIAYYSGMISFFKSMFQNIVKVISAISDKAKDMFNMKDLNIVQVMTQVMAFIGNFMAALPDMGVALGAALIHGFEQTKQELTILFLTIKSKWNDLVLSMTVNLAKVMQNIGESVGGKLLGIDAEKWVATQAKAIKEWRRSEFMSETQIDIAVGRRERALQNKINQLKEVSKLFDSVMNKSTKGLEGEQKKIQDKITKYIKAIEDIVKGAAKKFDESIFSADEEQKTKPTVSSPQESRFAAFAEFGTQEASRLFRNMSNGRAAKVQEQQLGVLNQIRDYIKEGNTMYGAELRGRSGAYSGVQTI